MRKSIFSFFVFTSIFLTGVEAKSAVLDENLVLHQWIAQIRDKRTDAKAFRDTLEKIGEKLAEKAMTHLIPRTQWITNPMGEVAPHIVMAEKPVIVAILRAGLPLAYGMQRVFTDSSMGFIGSARNEETAVAKSSYLAIPEDIEGKTVLLVDTMLGTGGTFIDAMEVLMKYRPGRFIVMCAIAAPEGIERIQNRFGSNVAVIAAAIDQRLNEHHYIIPGLGDAGDRAFGRKLYIEPGEK